MRKNCQIWTVSWCNDSRGKFSLDSKNGTVSWIRTTVTTTSCHEVANTMIAIFPLLSFSLTTALRNRNVILSPCQRSGAEVKGDWPRVIWLGSGKIWTRVCPMPKPLPPSTLELPRILHYWNSASFLNHVFTNIDLQNHNNNINRFLRQWS